MLKGMQMARKKAHITEINKHTHTHICSQTCVQRWLCGQRKNDRVRQPLIQKLLIQNVLFRSVLIRIVLLSEIII